MFLGNQGYVWSKDGQRNWANFLARFDADMEHRRLPISHLRTRFKRGPIHFTIYSILPERWPEESFTSFEVTGARVLFALAERFQRMGA